MRCTMQRLERNNMKPLDKTSAFKIMNMPDEAIAKMDYKQKQLYYKLRSKLVTVVHEPVGTDPSPRRK